jgi:hypothetical protein
MATKRLVQLASWNGIKQNQTGTIDLPIGPRYHSVILKVQAAGKTLTQILSEIRVKVNGKVQRVHTATELDALNTLQGTSAIYASQNSGGAGNAYYLTLFFAEPWRVVQQIREGLAWSTGGLGTFQIETDFNATAESGGALSCTAWAEVDSSLDAKTGAPDPLGIISKWYRTQIPVVGTSQPFTGFPKRDAYQQISFFDANISQVQIKIDNIVIRDIPKAVNDAVLVKAGMVPIAGRFDLIFDHDDILGSALPMQIGSNVVQDFQCNLTLSDGTARNIPVIYQLIGNAD